MYKSLSKFLLLSATTLSLSACLVTPEIITNKQHAERAQADLAKLYKEVPPLEQPLSLSEAISRGLMYNFDYKMGLMEEVLQNNQLTLANFNMLPRLAANAGYGWRSDERATQSISLITRQQSLEPSFSEERVVYNADLSFSWNILDFGLSYYQAKQQADRVLSAVERRRRVMNNMVKEIHTAYWKAHSAEKLLPEVEGLIIDVDQALAQSEIIESKKLDSPLKSLEYRKSLLQLSAQLKQLRAELSIAKSQLRSLVNLPPSQEFILGGNKEELYNIPVVEISMEDVQNFSLINRPELREEAYQERIDQQNVKKEIIRLFPGLSLLGSSNFDSNKYLAFQNWQELGVRATWNLISLLQGPKAIETAEAQVEIAQMRRLALSAAVLSQVSISYNQYLQALEKFKTADELSIIEEKVLMVSKNYGRAKSGNKLEQVRKAAQSLAARLERSNALADAQAAYATLLVSVGVDLVHQDEEAKSLEEMTNKVREDLLHLNGNPFAQILDKQATLPEEEYKALVIDQNAYKRKS